MREIGGVVEQFGESWHLLVVGCALVRRVVFESVSLFDESMPYGEDIDWFYRVREAGPAVDLHDAVTLYYRRHADNMTNSEGLGKKYFLLALKHSLDRRRGGSRTGETPRLPPWTGDEGATNHED